VNAEDQVSVRPLVYGDCAINIEVPRFNGEPLVYRLEPQRDYDEFGQPLSAPVVGQEYKSLPKTDADRAADALARTAYPGLDAEGIRKARERGTTPFNGEIDAHGYLRDVERQTWLPRRGTEIEVHARGIVEETPLSVAELARALRKRGVAREDLYAWLQAQYPEGAQESSLDDIYQRLQAPGAAPLRAVG